MVMSEAISDSLTSRSGARAGAAGARAGAGWMSATGGASKRAASGVDDANEGEGLLCSFLADPLSFHMAMPVPASRGKPRLTLLSRVVWVHGQLVERRCAFIRETGHKRIARGAVAWGREKRRLWLPCSGLPQCLSRHLLERRNRLVARPGELADERPERIGLVAQLLATIAIACRQFDECIRGLEPDH